MEDPFSHHAHRQSGGRSGHEWAGSSSSTSAPHETNHKPIISRIGRGGRIGQGGLTLVFFLVRELARAPISVRLYAFSTLKKVAQATNRLNGFLKGMNE